MSRNLAALSVRTPGTFFRLSRKDAPLEDWKKQSHARFSGLDLPLATIYCSESKETCFWEIFGDELISQIPTLRRINATILKDLVWKTITIPPRQPLACIDLTNSKTLRAIGADGSTFLSGYPVTQAWAKVFMEHPDKIDGLIYTSRLDTPTRNLAIFNRQQPQLRAAIQGPALDDLELQHFLLKEGIALKL